MSSMRARFPALAQTDPAGRPYVFFDGPGGSQVPQDVIDAMGRHLVRANSNTHGAFLTSRRTDEVIAGAREAAADFLNAPSPREIVFGPNMTSLTFRFSRILGESMVPGDEVIVTRLDHSANVDPWLRLQERGVIVRWVDFHPEDCTLDVEMVCGLLNERTRLVAVGYASNAVGSVNDVARIARWAREAGAWTYVDAVHYAPHGPIDVQQLGCDFLVCSAYKFFGPHIGMLWGREELLEGLHPPKVRPAPDTVPERFETGTQNHEGLAGLAATIDYLAELGQRFGTPFVESFPGLAGRRLDLKAGLAAVQAYENELGWQLIEGLQAIPGLRIWGITDPARAAERVPTVSFTREGVAPHQIAERLAEESIFVWDGNFYALEVTERLGLERQGGMVRVGLLHYNTEEEVDRLLAAVAGVSAS
jgi:cysteine desulfurase family protein (TIGR01976 family)